MFTGRDLLQKNHVDEAMNALQGGLALAEGNLWSGDLVRALREEIHHAERLKAAQELHLLIERIRPYYGVEALLPSEARAVESRCRRLWDMRNWIIHQLESQAEFANLARSERATAHELDQQLQADLLDLAILWTDLRVRLVAEEGQVANLTHRQEALAVLDQAELLFGPSCVLHEERQTHLMALGMANGTRSAAATAQRSESVPAPRTAWEHYALGRIFFRAGDLPSASSYFQRALQLQPEGFWPNFYWGQCAYQQARYDDAVLAFSACVVLAPNRALCFYNRGLAYSMLGKSDRALLDFDQSLRLDPDLAGAALSRRNLLDQGNP